MTTAPLADQRRIKPPMVPTKPSMMRPKRSAGVMLMLGRCLLETPLGCNECDPGGLGGEVMQSEQGLNAGDTAAEHNHLG